MLAKARTAENINWIVILCAVIAMHLFHLGLMERLPGYGSEFQAKRLVLNPTLAKALTFGYDRLLADYYWLIFLQYYGDPSSVKQSLMYAPAYLRLIVTLDPHFTRAYWFTSFVLAGDLGGKGAQRVLGVATARQYRLEAERILDDGIRDNPDDWTLGYIAGSSQYLFNNNAKRAAYYYQIASKVPGAPEFLKGLARVMADSKAPVFIRKCRMWGLTFLHSEGAAKEHARQQLQVLWSQIYYSPPNAAYKIEAERKLKEYDVPLIPREQLPPVQFDETSPAEPQADPRKKQEAINQGINKSLFRTDAKENNEKAAHSISFQVPYMIRHGDNLWTIACARFGEGKRWIDIYNLNRHLVGTNPRMIYPGCVLQMPPYEDRRALVGLMAKTENVEVEMMS